MRVVLLAGVVALAAALFAATPLQTELEERGLDLLFALRGVRTPPPAVAVVALDPVAAEALHLPPRPPEWPRRLHGRLVDGLMAAGARAVAFDLSFATPSPDPHDDELLAAALTRSRAVVLLDFVEFLGAADDVGATLLQRIVPPVPVLAAAAAAQGSFPLPKARAVRGWWLFRPGSASDPTLPLVVRRLHGGAGAARIEAGETARYLDLYGPARTVPTLRYDEVLAAEADAGAAARLRASVAGRSVFVGWSAATVAGQDRIRDEYPTVFTRDDGVTLSGVEIAATAFANLVEDRHPQGLAPLQQAALALAWALLLATLAVLLPSIHAAPALLAAAAAYLAVAHLRFGAAAQWLPLAGPLLVQGPVALVGGLLLHWHAERRERRRLGAVVDDLLPRPAVDELLGRIRRDAPDEREVWGVFVMTDIEGFTTISESLPPAELARRLNAYFELIFPPVERHGGHVSQINGDAMLAFWLAPAREQRAARHSAVLAALEIAQHTAGSAPGRLPTRIGIHAGSIALTRVGASRHHEWRAVGDAANTASRIESLSKHLGTRLLASADVVGDLGDAVLTRPLGDFVLAGKEAPVRIHEVVATTAAASADERERCADFGAALAAWQARRWRDAEVRWTALLARWPGDGPSRWYLDRARRHDLGAPPADWDGVIQMPYK